MTERHPEKQIRPRYWKEIAGFFMKMALALFSQPENETEWPLVGPSGRFMCVLGIKETDSSVLKVK